MIPTDIKVHCWLVLNSSIKIPCSLASRAQCRHWLPHPNCKTSLLSLLSMKRFVSSLFQCPEAPHLAESSLHPLIQMISKVMKRYNPCQIPILYGCQKFQLLTTTVLLQQHRVTYSPYSTSTQSICVPVCLQVYYGRSCQGRRLIKGITSGTVLLLSPKPITSTAECNHAGQLVILHLLMVKLFPNNSLFFM